MLAPPSPTLRLVLDGPNILGTEDVLTPLQSIRTLCLRLLYEGGVLSFTSLMKTVTFSGCLDLSVCIVGRPGDAFDTFHDQESEDDDHDVLDLRHFARTIFASPQSFIKVEHLRIDIEFDTSTIFIDISFVLPIEATPALKHLRLSSDLTIHLDYNSHLRDMQLHYPALRTVELNTLYKHLKEWAGWLAAKLSSQGENFDHFKVRARKNTRARSTWMVIPKETMRGWYRVSRQHNQPQYSTNFCLS